MNKEGYTLIESLMCMIMISIAAFGGIAIYYYASELQTMVMHKKIVTELANKTMEEVRATAYSTLTAGVTTSNVTVGGISATTSDGHGMTVTVTNVDDPVGGTNPDYKQVQVDVAWREATKAGKEMTLTLLSFVAP